MTRPAAEEIGIAVVDLAPDLPLAGIRILTRARLVAHIPLVKISELARGDARLQREFRVEERLFQVKWFEDLVLGQLGETVTRHAFEQNAERDETEIAVDDARARLVLEIEISDRARGAFGFVFGEDLKRPPRRQTGSVRQQLAHGDHLFVGALELGQIMKDG